MATRPTLSGAPSRPDGVTKRASGTDGAAGVILRAAACLRVLSASCILTMAPGMMTLDRPQPTDETSPKSSIPIRMDLLDWTLYSSVPLSTKFRTGQIRAEIFRTSCRLRFSGLAYRWEDPPPLSGTSSSNYVKYFMRLETSGADNHQAPKRSQEALPRF
ncbi:hypothetical protein PGT21_023356 [Puccinia graminis f. sp. tritici]|uniref:Uncharacterized protein n=1 Tax=Puccinia graminis f. sp. tritici TaxID=56615 RepID=A0A5B0M6H3_PUCGR|nr:hypothetical protein PGTUg99_018506 [Puccinia graminis f. sp. tritici]KAA1071936.1 hypothetical protein PGT21_023356 [Puccinia graminis f. sp. tritici]